MFKWANTDQTHVTRVSDGALIPAIDGNADYAGFLAWAAIGNAALPYAPPPVTADNIKAEAQRRIVALTGSADLLRCFVKQLNANMRANELSDKRLRGEALTAAEEAEAKALRGLAARIKAIRAASNILEAKAAQDFADDRHWPK